MELPRLPFPHDFMHAIWQRAAIQVAAWFGPIRDAGGRVSRATKADITLNLPLLEHCVRQLLRVLALQAGPITPAPAKTDRAPILTTAPQRSGTAPMTPPHTDHDTDDALKAELAFITRRPVFRLTDPAAASKSPCAPPAKTPALPTAPRARSGLPPSLGLRLTERFVALIDVFMDPEAHIQRMRVHLGQAHPTQPAPRARITNAHDRHLAEDARILQRFQARGVLPPNTS